jgi:hypothetical protein
MSGDRCGCRDGTGVTVQGHSAHGHAISKNVVSKRTKFYERSDGPLTISTALVTGTKSEVVFNV